MNKIKVAFIIVGWNNSKLLAECIESIRAQTHKNKEIIFVDNNSSDNSVDLVKAKFPEVTIIEMRENCGFAKGNNRGIGQALKDNDVQFVGLLNTDAQLTPDWTEKVVSTAIHKPKGASFQTITLDYYDHKIIDSTHIYVARNGQGTQGSWRRPILSNTDVAPKKIYGCNAAAVLYSRKFIEEQPYSEFFDETMFMYLEDVDVATRSTVMGWDNYVVPGARAFHMGSASSGKNPGFSLYMTFRNNTGMLVKNFPISILIRILPKLIYSDLTTLKQLTLARKEYGLAIKVIKGRIVSLLYIPIFMKKRHRLKPYIKMDSKLLWRMMHRGFHL